MTRTIKPACPTAHSRSRVRPAATNLLLAAFVLALPAILTPVSRAETCTTQSALAPAERDRIASAARTVALKVQANDADALRAQSVDELAKDFGPFQYLVAVTAPKLAPNPANAQPVVEQVYLLDATTLKRNPDGSASNAQFFCSLNRSTMEAEFDIPALPPGRYAFAMVTIAPPSAPWRLSFLMRQEPAGQGAWLLAGFYPKPLTAAGHDGLWYWTQARQMARDKQPWNAWLFYQEARKLLQPADFVLSTHLDKLHSELNDAAPPALSDGVSVDAPLVVKAADGTEYRIVGLDVGEFPAQSSVPSTIQSAPDLVVHLRVDPLPDHPPSPDQQRVRNAAAASALLAAYPELRKPFRGVEVSAEAVGKIPVITEQPMADIK